jgi:hypothetical protein
MNQLDLFRIPQKATAEHIDWNAVSGLDLAADLDLARRYAREVAKPFARRINRWRRQLRNGKRVPLCERLGFHVWALDGFNHCDCNAEVIGPWNSPSSWIPGAPLTTCWTLEAKNRRASGPTV